MWMFEHFGWWGLLMMALMVLFWGGLIILVVWAILRLTRNHKTQAPGKQDALAIARERYARGEITREQFEQLKKDLGS